jgi:hypothetical protein
VKVTATGLLSIPRTSTNSSSCPCHIFSIFHLRGS